MEIKINNNLGKALLVSVNLFAFSCNHKMRNCVRDQYMMKVENQINQNNSVVTFNGNDNSITVINQVTGLTAIEKLVTCSLGVIYGAGCGAFVGFMASVIVTELTVIWPLYLGIPIGGGVGIIIGPLMYKALKRR